MKDDWKPVVGFEGLYEISDTGKVKSLSTIDDLGRLLPERILTCNYLSNGYKINNSPKNKGVKYDYEEFRGLARLHFAANGNDYIADEH